MNFFQKAKAIFAKKIPTTETQAIKELLISNDGSYNTTMHLLNKIQKHPNPEECLKQEIIKILHTGIGKIETKTKPFIIFVYGVNGSGKTTTITKLAHHFANQNKKVIIAACDTFRAAASNQLVNALNGFEVITAENEKTDPASVAYNASQIAQQKNYDILIVDTAGRLHTNTNLMNELKKIHTVTLKNIPSSQYVNIAIMDSTIGQNSITQIQKFNEIIPISGIIITKLDTSAKGGALISIIHEMKQKVFYISHGTKKEDITVFSPEYFIEKFLN